MKLTWISLSMIIDIENFLNIYVLKLILGDGKCEIKLTNENFDRIVLFDAHTITDFKKIIYVGINWAVPIEINTPLLKVNIYI